MSEQQVVNALVKEIKTLPGWRVRETGKHITIFPPEGQQIIAIARTPSEYRWRANARSQLRRAGYRGDALG